MKVPKQVILDYISGNDIEYDLEVLENDPEFMYDVLKLTMDKKMYHFCSDSLKEDSDFSIKIAVLFKNDPLFAESLLTPFINAENGIDSIKYFLLLAGIFESNNKEKFTEYKLKARLAYDRFMALVSIEQENTSFKSFEYVMDYYESDNTVADYFALNMLRELLYCSDISFEKLVHERFRKIEDLTNYGEINFIIKYIEKFDESLASYLKCNQHLLKQAIKDLSIVEKGWESYTKRLDEARIDIINEELQRHIEERGIIPNFDYEGYIKVILKQLNIDINWPEELIEGESYLPQELKGTYDPIKPLADLDIEESLFVIRIRKYINKLFSSDTIDTEEEPGQVKKNK